MELREFYLDEYYIHDISINFMIPITIQKMNRIWFFEILQNTDSIALQLQFLFVIQVWSLWIADFII